MQLVIVTPNGIHCRTDIEKISLPGALGAFMVLPHHAPLISSLNRGLVTYSPAGGGGREERLAIRSGFVKVEKGDVEVCAEIDDTYIKDSEK